ncbi:hypothetical protein AgCh_016927 [Apium graveolens]
MSFESPWIFWALSLLEKTGTTLKRCDESPGMKTRHRRAALSRDDDRVDLLSLDLMKGGLSHLVSTDKLKSHQRMRNKASTDVSKASTDKIHQWMSASTDKASTANASTNKAING